VEVPAPYLTLVAVLVLGLLILLLRWGVGTSERRADTEDYGLLEQVATAPSRAAVSVVEQRLRRAGVRATVVAALDGTHRVLVFPADRQRAADALLADDAL
jgi:hypothetical protein